MNWDALVKELCEVDGSLSRHPSSEASAQVPLPSRDALKEMIEILRCIIFPGYFGHTEIGKQAIHCHVGAMLDQVYRILDEQIYRAVCFACFNTNPECKECGVVSKKATENFLIMLPKIKRLLATDVQAAYEGDPAATSPDETILCYPGILAITSQRIAHQLYELGVPLLPRMITELVHSETGIDIHPGAKIGEYFFIDHGTGVVIGETCIIGNRVRIYQGVTLGAKSFPLDQHGHPIKGIPRHPIVEDDVIIYGGATILGRITIGKGSIIGGNVWLTESVPPYSKVTYSKGLL